MLRIKKVYLMIICCIGAAAAAVLVCCICGFGHLHVRVVDAYTLMPIQNAKVIIPDTGKMLMSDSSGSCIFTGIPIRKNNLHNKLVRQNWGECTIISLYDGYRPTVIFNTRVDKNIMRSGPTVYMFPEELDDIEIAAIVESPDNKWISRLVEKYSG